MTTAKFFSRTAARTAAFGRAWVQGRRSPKEARLARDGEGVGVEELEVRRLLTGAVLSGGVLTYTGAAGAEVIQVYRLTGPGQDDIHIRVGATDYGPFATASITSRIDIFALAGNDSVVIESTLDVANGFTPASTSTLGTAAVSKIASVQGGDDNDSIWGGDRPDIIHGNAGDDTLNGRLGDDTMFGDTGADTMNGNEGYDLMYGGSGDGSTQNDIDVLMGDDGDDFLYGEGGADDLWTGRGNDSAYGGAGADRFFSDDTPNDSDYLDGQADSDFLIGSDPGDTIVSIEL